MYTGAISELQNWYYYQFPIKFMSGTQFSFGTPSPLTYTLVEADRQAAIQSFLFHKFAMANPNSILTKNLYSALKSKDPTAIKTFFAATQNFKNCTLSSWNAVMTWLAMFTSGWQGPYYLYVAAPSPLPSNYVPSLVGTLNIVSTATSNTARLTLCSQDKTGKLQLLSPAQGANVVMAGDGTATNQSPEQDVTLSLTPVWMNMMQTAMKNGKPTTSYLCGPMLSGTVAGTNVVSMQTLLSLPSQSASGSKGKSSWSGSQIFSMICQVVGVIVGVAMLFEMAKNKLGSNQKAKEEAKADATSDEDYNKQVKEIDVDTTANIGQEFNQNATEINQASDSVAESYSKAAEIQQAEVLRKTIATEKETFVNNINEQLNDGMTPSSNYEEAVKSTTEAFDTASKQIENGNLEGANNTISEAANTMKETINTSGLELQQSEKESLENSSESLLEAKLQTDAINDVNNEYQQQMDNENQDSGFNSDDPQAESEPTPEFIE
jgi:hypothetical protein